MKTNIYALVHAAGSPTELAVLLGLERRRGGLLVSQWLHRGAIPKAAAEQHREAFARLSRRAAYVRFMRNMPTLTAAVAARTACSAVSLPAAAHADARPAGVTCHD